MRQLQEEKEAQQHRQGLGPCCVTRLIHGQLQSGCHALDCQPLCSTCRLFHLLVHLWCMPSGPLEHALWSTAPAQRCNCDHCESPAKPRGLSDFQKLKPHVPPPGGEGAWGRGGSSPG